GRAIILVARVAAPVALAVAQIVLRVTKLAAFLANVAAVAMTYGVAILPALLADVAALFADIAVLRLRCGRNHHRGDQTGGEKFHLLHCAIPFQSVRGRGDLPDDRKRIRRVGLNRSGMRRLFSGH
ncbi:MAG: hypothetical protein ACRECQ_13510, partial [Burkholderiaceae bacterium]